MRKIASIAGFATLLCLAASGGYAKTPAATKSGPTIVIVFKDGREVALDHQKTSSSLSTGGVVLMSGQGAEVAIANRVANFLGVPFQEIAPPNMGMGVIQF